VTLQHRKNMVDNRVQLEAFASSDTPAAGWLKQALWYGVNAVLFHSWLCPFYAPKRHLLRLFGARIGAGVVIKPRVNIKRPWRLEIGDHSWIGEGVWIDNLTMVAVGSNCCISQGAYLCTGNHDWSDPRFSLLAKPIVVADQAWIGAGATVGPGVSIGEGSVATLGSVVVSDTLPWHVYAGNPATKVRTRAIRTGAPAKAQDLAV
jgi:putative colanic acid biosynthesis acetyltransferase WcaF